MGGRLAGDGNREGRTWQRRTGAHLQEAGCWPELSCSGPRYERRIRFAAAGVAVAVGGGVSRGMGVAHGTARVVAVVRLDSSRQGHESVERAEFDFAETSRSRVQRHHED